MNAWEQKTTERGTQFSARHVIYPADDLWTQSKTSEGPSDRSETHFVRSALNVQNVTIDVWEFSRQFLGKSGLVLHLFQNIFNVVFRTNPSGATRRNVVSIPNRAELYFSIQIKKINVQARDHRNQIAFRRQIPLSSDHTHGALHNGRLTAEFGCEA